MLTPRSDDENRKSELARKDREPDTFRHNPAIEINTHSGLVSTSGKALISDPRKRRSK